MFNLIKNDLVEATRNNDLEAVKKLIKRVNIDYKDKNHKSAIFYAVENKNLEMVKLFVENGANLHVRDDRGLMAIHYALIIGSEEIVNYLHNNQANIDIDELKENINGVSLSDRRYFLTIIKKFL